MAYEFRVLVDWDGNGAFAGTYDDVSADVLAVESADMGRDRASMLTGKSTAGTLSLRLLNETGKYSSFQTASPLYGSILPRRRVQILSLDAPIAPPLPGPPAPMGGYQQPSPLWTGYLESIEPDIDLYGRHTATLRAVGPLAIIDAQTAYSPPQTNILTGAAIGVVLDDVEWPVADRLVDSGQTQMTRWHSSNQQGLNALRDIEDTEVGFVKETADGRIAYEDRHHRLKMGHLVSRITFGDAPLAILSYQGIQQADPLTEIYNIITATIKSYTVGDLAVLWTLQEAGANSPALAPGETAVYLAEYPGMVSPPEAVGVEAWTTPVATTDYTANSQADGLGDNLTGSMVVAVVKGDRSMEITITNNAGRVAYLTLLQARGTPLSVKENTVQRTESASKTKYGPRRWPSPAKFLPNTSEGHDHIHLIGALYREPIPMVVLEFLASASSLPHLAGIGLAVSDRVSLDADARTKLGIDEDFFVERISHHIGPGKEHRVTLELSPLSVFGKIIVLDYGPGLDTGIVGY